MVSLLILGVSFLCAKEPDAGASNSIPHTPNTTHQHDVGQDGGPDGWNRFLNRHGYDTMYGGDSTFIAVRYRIGGVDYVDDGSDGDFSNINPGGLFVPSPLGVREHTFTEYGNSRIRIKQYTYSNWTIDGDDWLIYSFHIKNISGNTMENVKFMIHIDWDVIDCCPNRSGYESGIVYQYYPSSPYYAGMKLICGNFYGYGVKYYFDLSDDTLRLDAMDNPPNSTIEGDGDFTSFIVANLGTLKPNEEKVVSFALATSVNGLGGLIDQINRAEREFYNLGLEPSCSSGIESYEPLKITPSPVFVFAEVGSTNSREFTVRAFDYTYVTYAELTGPNADEFRIIPGEKKFMFFQTTLPLAGDLHLTRGVYTQNKRT